MEKKKAILVFFASLILIIICIVFLKRGYISPTAYSSNLEYVRSEESDIYDEYDYIFTKKYENGMLDFVIDNNTLYIVQFRTRKNGTYYHISSRSTRNISDYWSIEKENYDWNNSHALNTYPFKWCIVEKDFNEDNENYQAFEFTYQGHVLHLCYEIGNG